MNNLINVGVAQYGADKSPAILRTILGSCVGICIYDRSTKIGGMVHVLLPINNGSGNPEKYADTGIPLLIEKLIKQGAKKEMMSAKISGGAAMFKFANSNTLANIGQRNIDTAKQLLQDKGIPLVAEDCGGNVGRVIDFFLEDGRLKVKAAGEEKVYYKI